MPAQRAFAAVALLTLAACATPDTATPTQEIDFVRGCWVSKAEPGGRVTGFLRLLPPEPGALVLSGVSQSVMGNMVRDRFGFAFARDGSRLTITYPNGSSEALEARPDRAPPGSAAFGSRAAGLIVVTGGEDRLTIRPGDTPEVSGPAFFDGERDGCD